MSALRGAIRQGLGILGLELRKNPFSDPYTLQKRLTKPASPVIFDVGAHIGLTYRRYRALFPQGRIYAFEPFPASFAKLMLAMGGDPLASAYPLALSDRAGTSSLHVNVSEATNSLLATEADAGRIWGHDLLDTRERIAIETQTLDRFCHECRLSSVDLLKIDVQGAEYAVLSGASALLERRAIGCILFEFILVGTYRGQRPLHDYLALMDRFGYRLVDIFNPMRRHGRLLQADLMFASPRLELL